MKPKHRLDIFFLLIGVAFGCVVLWGYGVAGVAIFALAWFLGVFLGAALEVDSNSK